MLLARGDQVEYTDTTMPTWRSFNGMMRWLQSNTIHIVHSTVTVYPNATWHYDTTPLVQAAVIEVGHRSGGRQWAVMGFAHWTRVSTGLWDSTATLLPTYDAAVARLMMLGDT